MTKKQANFAAAVLADFKTIDCVEVHEMSTVPGAYMVDVQLCSGDWHDVRDARDVATVCKAAIALG